MVTELDLIVTVKAYPVMDAGSMSEAVCVAGVSTTEPRHWLRLFPLDFRALPSAQQFKKYQRITLRARRSRQDTRPESWVPELDSIQVHERIDTDHGSWRRRLELLDPVSSPSLCEIVRRQARDRTSLGVFRPGEIRDMVIAAVDPAKFDAKRGLIDQQSLLAAERKELQVPAVKCRYDFSCDDSACRGHKLSLNDWELGARWLQLERKGVPFDDIKNSLRTKFFEQLCSSDRDTRFICGNFAAHQSRFMVIGVVWPAAALTAQGSLF